VDVVLPAAAGEEEADLAAFEPVEQAVATNAKMTATSSRHLRAEDLTALPPLTSARC
jgi:hypothetical protein